jgi:hypothetical protein
MKSTARLTLGLIIQIRAKADLAQLGSVKINGMKSD